ncbi:MAG: hypothetical protein RIS76_1195 [Verrucomicrobiota bacterium]|jgi:formylglycine-generating enzyme required for sulfatase activity
MALIPAGSFTMGDALLDNGNNANFSEELPIRDVYVSAFYVDRYEVTQALWDRVKLWNDGNGYTYDNPGSSKGPSHPIQSMNWFDAVKWCNARSQMEGRTPCYYTDITLTNVFKTTLAFPFSVPYVNWSAKGYRLPTEAEWEKAARGGATGRRFAWSEGDTITQDRANYFSFWQDGVADIFYDLNPTEGFHPNFQFGDLPYTSPGGSFSPNGYGVYDAVGNVTEWCWDWFGKYPNGAQTDPNGPALGELRVMRGGNWNSEPSTSRMASRNSRPPGNFTNARVGFRTVLPAIQ